MKQIRGIIPGSLLKLVEMAISFFNVLANRLVWTAVHKFNNIGYKPSRPTVATHMSDLAGSAALVEIEAVADSRVACGVCVHAQFQTFVLFNQLDVSGAGETGEWQENQKPSHITMVIKDVACVLMDSGTS